MSDSLTMAPWRDQLAAMRDMREATMAENPQQELQLLERALQQLDAGPSAMPMPSPMPMPMPGGSGGFGGMGGIGGSGGIGCAGGGDTGGGLTVNTAANSINTGRYTITASKGDDGSLTITDNETGKTVEAWGDPHLKVNGQNVADFQKDGLNIQLQDGTVVHIDPTALQNGVAHIGQVSVTKGDDAVTMSGFTGSGPVQTSGVMEGAAAYQNALYNSPNATDVTMGADGNLYYNNANGSMGSEITATNGQQTDLDGAGGGLVGQGSGLEPNPLSEELQWVMGELTQAIALNSEGCPQSNMERMLGYLENQQQTDSV